MRKPIASLVSSNTINITGRGELAVVDLSKQEGLNYSGHTPFRIGDIVMLDGKRVEIMKIETMSTIMSPPSMRAQVGVMFREC